MGSGFPGHAYFDSLDSTRHFVSIFLTLFGCLGLLSVTSFRNQKLQGITPMGIVCFIIIQFIWWTLVITRGTLRPFSLDRDLPAYVEFYVKLNGAYIGNNLKILLAVSELLTIGILPIAFFIVFLRGYAKLGDIAISVLVGLMTGSAIFLALPDIGSWLAYHQCGDSISALR